MNAAYTDAMTTLLGGADLDRAQAEAAMVAMMEGQLEHAQVGAFLTALSIKGETVEALTGFARVMRSKARRAMIEVDGPLVDTCGTGGSGLPTANTSTMCAFVLAADGVKVAKHGNRASSGRCGSSDVLEALGLDLDVGPEEAAALIEEIGVALLFAPLYHPAVRHVVPVRRQLGFRTVFNFLGPLCNPAGATHHLMGVSDPERAPMMAEALRALGCTRALLVRGEDGLDEVTLTGPTRMWALRDGQIQETRFEPEDIGLESVPFEAIAGGGPEENLRIFKAVISGRDTGPRAQHLKLNAGAALFVAGRVGDLKEGYHRAGELIASGAAMGVCEAYRIATAHRRAAA